MTKITKIKTALRNRWLTCLLLLIGWSVSLNAQNVSTYNFAQIAGTYVPIGSGTSALGAGIDDASGSPQSIGFNFTYHGVVYTQFTAQSNGYITLGGIISQNYTPLSGVPDCISFAGGDGRSGPSGIYYAVSGSAPNRVLTIEQPNYYYSYQTNSDYVNVQIKLFETSNDIQIIYGAGAISGSYSRQLGITGASVADFAVRTTSTNWASTTAAGLNSGVMTLSSTVFPANGQTYVFSPPYTYCAGTATTVDETITNVTFGSINNSSGWTGYANYFATTNTNLTSGNSYNISATISPFYSGDNMSCWIDYNHSGTFDASERTIMSAASASSGTVVVPSTALYGVTTMRVRLEYFGSGSPCGTQTYGEVEDYKVTIAPATGCTGTPSASSTLSNSNPVCTGVNFTLSLGTTYSLSGITYQWQSADDAGFTVNVANLGTASTQITSQTAAKYYRCQITCTNSGLSIFSSVLNEGLTTGALCLTYCTSLPSNTADEEIYQITINGASTPGAYANGNGCTTAAPGPGSILSRYSNFKTLGNLTSVQQLQTVSFEVRENECDAGSLYANGVGIWVDFNQNGSFTDAGEAVFIEATTSAATGASPGGDKVVTGTFQIPVTALTGQTVMRITAAEGYSGAILTPCLAYGYGETEDWIINITSAPACSGTPTPGNTLSTVATACSGANFTLSLQNFTTGTGVTYQWQSSPDNSTWTDIGGPTPNATLTVSQTAATYYRSIVTCSGGGSGASNGILVGMSPFYNCYCTTNLGGICGTQSINSVVVAGTTLNNVTNGCSTPYNSFPASGSTTANFVPNQSYNFTVGTGNNGNPAQIAVWIDFNQSGTYDVSEYTLISSSSASGGTSTLAVSIPLTALPGQTGMRIRSDWASSAAFNGSIACNNLPYGETEDYTVTIISLPATPSTPIEVGIPNCATGGNLDPNGTAPVGETWYWQSTASGTSTANPASGLFNILANGTYYLRAQNNTFLTWSTNSSSVTVTDFPAGPADPSVSSPANPACGTVSLVSSVALAGTTNYWQGTNPTGTSTASIADNGTTNNPYSASADGVYYVRAQDNTSFCWSNPVAITVTVWAPPTQPIVNASPLTVCPNSPVLLSAVAPSAPITGYSVTSLNYATMPSPETTTLANAGPTGDEGTVVANLGFSFNYFGTIYSQVQIHTNGYLVFGSSNYVFGGYSPTGPIPTTANTNNWFGHWADMNASAGQISYETQGVAPNRKFIVNYNHDNYYSATPYYSGQLVINELDGSMDIYITHMQTTYTSAVGLENIDGTIGTAAPGHNNVAVAADNEAWHFAPIQAIGFLWSANTAGNGGIASGDEVLANTTGNPPSTTTYTMTLTEPVHGCQSSNSVVVTVSPVPPAPSTTAGATACGSGTVTLGATGTGGTLQWFDVATGGTVLGTGTSFTTPSINANTTFYVEENNGTCSGPRAAVLATYTTAPSTTVNSDVTFVCNDGTNTGPGGINNNTVNLSASSGYGYTSYVWTSNPAGFNASGQNVSATPSVNTVYTVTASDGVCTYVNTISVNAGQVPNITSVSGTPPTICQGNTSQLVAAVAGSSGGSVPSGYCSPIMFASNPCNYLNSVATTGGVTNFSNTTASYNGTGYTFFPAYTVSQTLGSSFTLTCQTQGTCGIAYYSVWADWNRDGDFDDVGENVVVANGVNSANNITNFTITIPVTASPGATRIRVLANGNSVNPTTACDNFSPFYSEIEDYVIDILGGAGYNFSWTGAGLSATNIFNPVATLGAASTTYNVTVSDAFGCSSTGSVTISEPTAAPGNTLSTTPSACIGVSFTLSTQNNPPGASYQWQSSPDGTTWTDIGSATNPTYTTTQSVATYYRCNVGCPSGSNFTTPIQITQNSFYNCYCTAGATTVGCTSGDEYVGNFTFNTINNSSGCPPSGQYSNFTSISTTIFQNQTYTASVLIPNWFSGDQAAIWIDFDHNGVFDDITEKFSLTSGGGNGTTPYTGSVLIPSNALGGVTGLRVRGAYTGTVSSCGVVTYGEVEDYLVTIGDENCVLAPIYPANAAQICPDNDLALSWPANAGAIGYDVYFDANNPNPTTLVSASQLGTSYSTGVLNTTDTYYWKVVPLYASATCTTPQVFSFTFKPGPTPDATSSAPVCEGQSLSLFGNNTDPLQTTGNSYSWSGPNGFNDVVQNPTINGTTPAAAGTYTVTVTNQFGCTSEATTLVAINALPALNILSQVNVGCTGGSDGSFTIEVTNAVVNGNYLYDENGNTNFDGIFTNYPAGSYTVQVTDDNSCASSIGVTIGTTSTAPPAGSCTIVSFPLSGCVGTTVSVSTTVSPGATGYNWSVPAGTLINGQPGPLTTVSNTVTLTLGALAPNSSAWEICAFASNGCGQTNTNCKYIRGSLSLPSAITGSTVACPSTTGTYSTTAVTGASGYSWTGTNGITFTGSGTSVTANFPAGFTSGTICVSGTLPCGYSGPSRCINVTNGTPLLGVMSGLFTVCPGAIGVSYSVPPSPGANTYNWVLPTGATIASGTGTNAITVDFGPTYAGGSICVTAQSVCGINSLPRCRTIASNKPATPGNIGGAATGICNQTITYTIASVAGATGYTWTAPAGATVVNGQNTNTVDVTYASNFTTGQLCVTANNGCGSSAPRCITVKGSPSNPGIISGPAIICAFESGDAYSIASVFGASGYVWSVPAGAVIQSGQGTTSILVDWGANGGTIGVTATGTCGNSGTRTLNVAMTCKVSSSSLPGASISAYPNPVSSNLTVELEATNSGAYTVELMDLSGRVVYSTELTAVIGFNSNVIDVSNFSKGVYTLSVKNNDGFAKQIRVAVQ